MLNSKQRNYLRSLAADEPDIIHIGKEGITPNVIVQLKDALKARELVKGKVQQSSIEDVRDVAKELAESAKAEIISIIGNKFILYKRNEMKQIIELPKTNK